tara:strand:- start:19 stop:459 length:441 start_codon:yes stop_codon:yes gene_type:complete
LGTFQSLTGLNIVQNINQTQKICAFLFYLDGKPNNSFGYLDSIAAVEPARLDQSVSTVAVVALTSASGAESATGVEVDCGFVVACDFESGVNGTVLTCPLQQAVEKRPAIALPAVPRIDSQHGDLKFINNQPTAGNPDERLIAHQP